MRNGDLARARWSMPLFAVALVFVATVAAALTFPPLTGRIVDQADILSPAAKAALEPKLADLEEKSGIQLVVATVSSLEGQEIEPYANELFRAWKLGEAEKNNGVLLLVAPNERRVRIEVGYGLEGTLTDALSKVIITNAITPRFKAGDFSGGVTRGVDDIITVLTTDASEWEARPELRLDRQPETGPPDWLLIAAFFGFVTLFVVSSGFRRFVNNVLLGLLVSSGGGRSGGHSRWRLLRRRELGRRWRRLFRRRRIVGRRRRVGGLVMEMSPEDRDRITAAIRAVEARTTGEIVCVLAEQSADSGALPILLAALAALASPWLLVAFTALPVLAILSWQIVVFLALALLLCLPRVRVALIPRRARRAMAFRVATEQFFTRAISRKRDRSGILIFVSLAEHYARIIADDGIDARVPQSHWQGAVDALIAHAREGRVADGFIAAIEMCGAVLAEHFPRTDGSPNELPTASTSSEGVGRSRLRR